MKLPLSCFKCYAENPEAPTSLSNVEFRDDGRYEVRCANGHVSVTILQQQKFEVLFDIGAYALKDGYYREAVSSFTSSLERFYEFVIKAILIRQDIEINIIKKIWKQIANQSERQLGAYIFLYLNEFGQAPDILSQNNITFRNAVIHKGKIPSREEALKYGNDVLNICRPIIKALKDDYKEELEKITFHHIKDSCKQGDLDVPISTMCMPTILSLSSGEPEHDDKTLETVIKQLRKRF